jgi:hypothetical protein
MARVFIDGFESGGMDCWDYINGAVASVTQKYTGSYGLNFPNIVYNCYKDIPSQFSYYFAFRFRPGSSGLSAVINLNEANTNHINIEVAAQSGGVVFVAKRSSTQIAIGTTVYVINVWLLVEVYALINDSTGRVIVKINGADTEIDFTGDTRNGGTLGKIDRLGAGLSVSNVGTSGYFDDFVVDDAGWIGDTRIVKVGPSGAGNAAQWDPSAGSNYACVDEVPPSDADYVSTNVNDEIDTYAAENLPGEASAIKCVQVMARAQKEGAATPQNVALVVRTGGTDYPSADQLLATSYRGHLNLWENNPNTASPWATSEVDGMEIGVKSRA